MLHTRSVSPCYCYILWKNQWEKQEKSVFQCVLLPQSTYHRTFAVIDYTRKIKMEEIRKNTGYKRFAFMICGYAPAERCVG